jgi:hypothetical protein
MTQTLALVNAFDAFIKGCKTDGTWGAIKASCILAGWNNLDGALTPLVGAAPTNFNFWGDADPHWANVSLLLRMNGANASTTFTDSSSNAFTVSRFGNAQISTAQSKFGGASGLFDGNGDYLSCAYNAALDLNGSVFTIEAWVYPTAYKASGVRVIAAGGGAIAFNSTNGIHFLFQINAGGTLNFQFWDGSTAAGQSTTATVPLSAWSHIAVSVSGTNMYLAINGVVQQFTATIARPSTNPIFTVGTINGETGGFTTAFQGNIDDLRITKGVARYTANFTPPTRTHPEATADYDRETGLVADGSTKYLDTNSSPTAAPETLTNFAYAVYCSALPTNGLDAAFIGYRGNTDPVIYQLFRDSTNLLSVYNKTGLPVTRSQTTGFIGSARSGTSESIRSGGANTTAASSASGSYSSQTNVGVYSFREVNGNRLNLSNARISFYMQAGFLDLALLDTRVTTLINAIAAAIP